MEHGRVRQSWRSPGCGATPMPGKAQTRGLHFLVRVESERAKGGTVREGARE